MWRSAIRSSSPVGDTGSGRVGEQLERLRDDHARLSLLRDLARRLALDHSSSIARRSRAYTSSGVPVPSIRPPGCRARGSGRAPARSPPGTRSVAVVHDIGVVVGARVSGSPQVSQMRRGGRVERLVPGVPDSDRRAGRDAEDDPPRRRRARAARRSCALPRQLGRRAPRPGHVRGNPSSRKPLRASSCEMRSRASRSRAHRGRARPPHVLLALPPSAVPRAGAPAACRRSRCAAARARPQARRLGPLPPRREVRRQQAHACTTGRGPGRGSVLQEALVVAHHHLRLTCRMVSSATPTRSAPRAAESAGDVLLDSAPRTRSSGAR